jgi:hypothetical protein
MPLLRTARSAGNVPRAMILRTTAVAGTELNELGMCDGFGQNNNGMETGAGTTLRDPSGEL